MGTNGRDWGATRGWRVLQAAMLAGAAALWIACWADPELGLAVLWGGVVPVLPALWMIHPGLWRNVCPLATLEMLGDAVRGSRLTPEQSVRRALPGIVALAALVPARRLIFDGSGPAVGAVLTLLAASALVRGRFHAAKSGFCNTLCPMGALERLYGQRPIAEVANARCASCSLCTARGCPDLTARKALVQLVGPSRRTWRGVLRPHGAFAGSMPGFAVGFAAVPTGASALLAYALPLGGALVSWTVTLLVARGVDRSSERILPWLAALTGLVFYWLVAPAGVARWGVAELPGTIRGAGTLLVAVWALRAGPWRAVADRVRVRPPGALSRSRSTPQARPAWQRCAARPDPC